MHRSVDIDAASEGPALVRRACNPLLYAVNAERALFAGNLGGASVVTGFAVIGGLAVLAVGLAVRQFRRAMV